MKSSNEYIISIVVPTKNRQEYAIKTVEQILLCDEPDIQVVIQDNSDDNKLQGMLKPFFHDKRLKYNYSSGVLSFVDNFSIAISLSDGEYICVIGDDDGINPEIVKIARWARKKQIDAIKPSINVVFIWPDTGIIKQNSKANSGYMTISKISSKVQIADTSIELKKLLNNGCQKYLDLDLVKLYHGIVLRDKIELIKIKTGKYFGGLTPDIYSAVSLSIAIPEVVCIDYPLTISGVCKKSGSADSVTGKHTGKYEEAPHLNGHKNYEWSSEVPKFYSVETIWAESSLTAIKDMKKHDLLDLYREESLAAYCVIKYSEYADYVKMHYLKRMKILEISKSRAWLNLVLRIVTGPGFDFVKRVIKKITRRKKDLVKLYSINDIIQAQNELSAYLESNNLTIMNAFGELESKIMAKVEI